MEIIYKKLTEKEIDRVIKLRIAQLTDEYTSEGKTVPENINLDKALKDFYTRNLAAGTYVSWLAFDGDKIVGTSGMSFAEKPPYFTCTTGKLGILSSMYTDPDYRRKGIATELLDRVVKEAKDHGCGTIYITASDMGVKLYESYGFKHNGNFMQYNFA
ncbi:Acetyltransferase (GNAT) family protein [Lachnospiraceae bacterium XPB1003]|nr:Acetyltransferase (GNAT) family protein [Lachnospiraceae bacterium XPB1003]